MNARKEDSAMIKKYLRPVIIGAVVGAMGCLLILLVIAAIMAAKDIPQAAITPMAVVAAAIGSFIGGLVAARMAGMKGLLIGAAVGLLLYVIVMVAGFAYFREIRGTYVVVKMAIMVACAAVGGVIGVNMHKR